MATTAEKVAEDIASSIEGRIVRLRIEREEIAKQRTVADVDAEIAELEKELAVYQPRRPKPKEMPREVAPESEPTKKDKS